MSIQSYIILTIGTETQQGVELERMDPRIRLPAGRQAGMTKDLGDDNLKEF